MLAIGNRLLSFVGSTAKQTSALGGTLGAGVVIRARRAENITHVWVAIDALAAGDRQYNVGLQGITGSSLPDGTWKSTPGVIDTATHSAGFQAFAITSYACSAGEDLALVVVPLSGTTGDITINIGMSQNRIGAPYLVTATSGPTWSTNTANYPPWGLTGSVSGEFGNPILDAGSVAASDANDRVAARFIPPATDCASVKIMGVRAQTKFTNSQGFSFGIWNGAGTQLALVACDGDNQGANTSWYTRVFYLPPVTVAGDVPTYIGWRNDTVAIGIEAVLCATGKTSWLEGRWSLGRLYSWDASAGTPAWVATEYVLLCDVLLEETVAGGGGGPAEEVYLSTPIRII